MDSTEKPPVSRLGFVAVKYAKYMRVTSYSSYCGRHDPVGYNCFGQLCRDPVCRKPQIWKTREAAERNLYRDQGEAVAEIYPSDDDLRETVRAAANKPEILKVLIETLLEIDARPIV